MKTKISKIAVSAFALAAAFSVFTAQGAENMCSACAQALANFKYADSSLQNTLANSAGYAVFPDVGKGGFIIGGAHGKGCVFENGRMTGTVTLAQGTFGAQIGGKTYSELIVFHSQNALNNLRNGSFSVGAGVSGAIATQGASQVVRSDQGVSVFTLPKAGLMGEAVVGGQKFSYQPIYTGTVAANCPRY